MRKALHLMLGITLALPSVSASATAIDELANSTVSVGGLVSTAEDIRYLSEESDGKWYFVYNNRTRSSKGVTGGYLYDGMTLDGLTSTNVMHSLGTSVLSDEMNIDDAAPYLVRFVYSESTGYYYMQFGTGTYVARNGTALYITEDESSATPWSVYDIETGYMGIWNTDRTLGLYSNAPGSYFYLANTDANATTVTDYTANDYAATFQFFEATIETTDEYSYALSNLVTARETYSAYVGTFTTGTDYGTYGADEVAAFEEAVSNADYILRYINDELDEDEAAPSEEPTAESLTALKTAIEETYAAVLASLPDGEEMEIEEGYYFLQSYPGFYVTYDEEDGVTPVDYPTMGMYSYVEEETIYAAWMVAQETAQFLWKVTRSEEEDAVSYILQNMATDAQFNEIGQAVVATMNITTDNPVVFSYYSTNDDGTYNAHIRLSAQAADSYYYLQQADHSKGMGTSGSIIGWSRTSDPLASAWNIVKVSDELAQDIIDAYADEKETANKYLYALAIIEAAEAEMEIARDESGTLGLITSASQMTASSYLSSATSTPLSNLIDGDLTTRWHSAAGDSHNDEYLQVTVDDMPDMIFATIGRYDNTNTNHNVITLNVAGVDDPDTDAAYDDLPFVASLSVPFDGSATYTSSDAFETNGYTTLRFYTGLNNNSETSYYFQMAEFQLYRYGATGTTQADAMGEIYTNLEEAIADVRAEGSDMTDATYEALVAAYEAFKEIYVDPAELRTALANASTVTSYVVEGTNPGQWSDTEVLDEVNNLIDTATNYDESGAYTPAQSADYVDQLNNIEATVLAAANPVETGKWYEIRLGTEDEYSEYDWSTSDAAASGSHAALYGKYIAVANYDDEGYAVDYMPADEVDEICIGQRLYLEDYEDLDDADYVRFRFVNVGDTAYMLQNKATGLFIKAAGSTGYATLSVHPTLFTTSAVGYGQSTIAAKTLTGDSQNNLHAQRTYNTLVTWDASGAGTNSGFFIEDTGLTVDDSYDPTTFNVSVQAGALNALCFPFQVTANEGTAYGVEVDTDYNVITLKPLDNNTAAAGQPFIYMSGALSDYDETSESYAASFTRGSELAVEPLTSGKLVGVYYATTLAEGCAVTNGNEFVLASDGDTASANSAYINATFDSETDITLDISEETYDAINSIVEAVNANKGIYTIDGVRVSSIAKPGLYIVDGKKVMVK